MKRWGSLGNGVAIGPLGQLSKLALLVSLIVLTLACVQDITINQDPFKGQADYLWNKDVLLANNEQEQVFMYGVQISIPDYQLSLCSGYGANICLDKSILEYFTGEQK